jgi:hypothetical protein
MTTSINVAHIVMLHRDAIITWKASGVHASKQDFLRLVEENHAFNYQLWHAEDRARRDDLGHEFVYLAKREIDACNQQRNDRMEAMDVFIMDALKPLPATQCPVHSETPGMMIDRLSILALKAYHMGAQLERKSVDESHREACRQKLALIMAQKEQLTHCLEELLHDLCCGKRTFCMYYQFKMYNNKNLNPHLYQE